MLSGISTFLVIPMLSSRMLSLWLTIPTRRESAVKSNFVVCILLGLA